MDNPTIQRRRLGNALKRAREQAGRMQDEAAQTIDAAGSKISRIELGQSGLRLTDLNILLDFYAVPEDERESMRELARAGRQRGRWSGFRNSIPDWFRQYVDLEADATALRWYQNEVVPGILQTDAYIRAVLTDVDPAAGDHEVNQRVEVRLQRQSILDRADAPELSFILSESALRRAVGGAVTMRDQLHHLVKIGSRRNVSIQVLPFDAESYTFAAYSFTIMRFGPDSGSDVIYVESYTDADYFDRPDAVRAYTRLWERLQAAASGPVESLRLMTRVADQIEESGQ